MDNGYSMFSTIRSAMIDGGIGIGTRRDAIRVMLQFMKDVHDNDALSDEDVANRLSDIDDVLDRIDDEKRADVLIDKAMNALDEESVGCLERAEELRDQARKLVHDDYPDLDELCAAIEAEEFVRSCDGD